MRRKYIAFIGAILLLTSCGERKLRSDIDKFITSFSLQDAVASYLEAGYESVRTQTGGEVETKEEIFLSFNVKDASHPQYKKETKKYENNVLKSDVVEEIKEDDSGFIFAITDREDMRYTLEECHDVIKTFFYKESLFDGTYNVQGMYYGDYLKQVAPGLQDYVTIDEENQLYIMEYSKDEKINGYNAHVEQKYSVNKLGMLEKNHFIVTRDEEKIEQNITVFVK